MDAFVAIWVAGAITLVYGGYHYWIFIDKLERARMGGKIPSTFLGSRMGIVWMIASPDVVPDGASHRRKAIYALSAFACIWLTGVAISIWLHP